MTTIIKHYRAKKIINVHKHADGWFWDKYSAHPYKGCEHACEYCYTREEKYYPYKDPADFSRVIRIKDNANKLLRNQELPRLEKDIIVTGDYQPIKGKHSFPSHSVHTAMRVGNILFPTNRRKWELPSNVGNFLRE